MRLVNISPRSIIVEFNQELFPTFHNETLARMLYEFGIEIKGDVQKKHNYTSPIYPPQEPNDIKANEAFFTAFKEVYAPKNLENAGTAWE